MTDSTWDKALALLEENERALVQMSPAEPMPTAKWCRESAHRTLGHLTACQSAWLHLMRGMRDGAQQGSVPVHPNPLYRKLGFSTLPWEDLLGRFVADRREWRGILGHVEPEGEIQTSRRVYSAQSLTQRMVDHEKRHIGQLS